MSDEQEHFEFLGELPAESNMEALSKRVRGRYDISRLQQTNPQLVGVIEYLLSMPGFSRQMIADICGVAWETVEAVAVYKSQSVRELKAKFAAQLAVALDLAGDQLIQRIKDKGVTALDYKLLAETWQLLNGQATQIVELQRSDPASQKMAELFAELASQAMGRSGGKVLQSGGDRVAVPGEVLGVGSVDGQAEAVPVVRSDAGQVIDVEVEEIG